MLFVQCAFLVAQVEICRSPNFVIAQPPYTEPIAMGANYLDTARFIELLYVGSLFSFLGI